MLKVTSDLLEAFGCKTEAEFLPSLITRLTAAEAKAANLEMQLSDFSAEVQRIDAGAAKMTETLGSLTSTVQSIKVPSSDEVKALATDAGALAAAVALGKCGLSPVAPAPVSQPAANTVTFRDIVAGYVKDGMSKGAAVQHAVKTHTKEYAAARAAGHITL